MVVTKAKLDKHIALGCVHAMPRPFFFLGYRNPPQSPTGTTSIIQLRLEHLRNLICSIRTSPRISQFWLRYSTGLWICLALALCSGFTLSFALPFGKSTLQGFAGDIHGLIPWNTFYPDSRSSLQNASVVILASFLPVAIRPHQPLNHCEFCSKSTP